MEVGLIIAYMYFLVKTILWLPFGFRENSAKKIFENVCDLQIITSRLYQNCAILRPRSKSPKKISRCGKLLRV